MFTAGGDAGKIISGKTDNTVSTIFTFNSKYFMFSFTPTIVKKQR